MQKIYGNNRRTIAKLSDNSYIPFLKTDQYSSYINVNSNHPNFIIKQVPKAVNTRISRLSSNKKIFLESSKMYIEALKNSGFKEEFSYLESRMNNNNNNNDNELDTNKENTNCNNKINCCQNRKGKILWFNPPFCKLGNINIGKYFFQLIDKHFNQYIILHKILIRKL